MSDQPAAWGTTISIALCTYNGEHFLPAQLESYLDQTRLPDELVICDDGSTDGTASLITNFAKNAPFAVRLQINKKTLGSTKNFEQAIQFCTGDLIFLSDQDDIWMPEKLEVIEAGFCANTDCGLIFSNARLADQDLNLLDAFLWDLTFPKRLRKKIQATGFLKVLLSQDIVTGATMAFRRKYFMPIPDEIPHFLHDGWISLLVAARAEIKFIDKPLVIYRQHAGQQVGLWPQMMSAKTHSERKIRYDKAIGLLEAQMVRLTRMNDSKAGFPPLEKILAAQSIDQIIEEKKELIKHLTARKDLPYDRRGRISPIIREIFSGRYRRFSRGILSPAKDLFKK